jgi:hypothetical protein
MATKQPQTDHSDHDAVAVFLLSAVVFLGLSVAAGTGPHDHPVIWLLLMALLVCYKELIAACALTFIRSGTDAFHE